MSVRKQPWFERTFPLGQPPAALPLTLARLRGTPARLEDLVARRSREVLTRRSGETWSIQENIGHLLDLEPLWMQRVEDLLTRRPTLTAADLTNRKTHEANHNAARLPEIVEGFRRARAALVARLEGANEDDLTYTATHPRLSAPMNLVDHAFFVAEHDDYHLVRIAELLRAVESGAS